MKRNKYRLTEILHEMFLKKYGWVIYVVFTVVTFSALAMQTNAVPYGATAGYSSEYVPTQFLSYNVLLEIANIKIIGAIGGAVFCVCLSRFLDGFLKENSNITLLTLPMKRIELFWQGLVFVLMNALIMLTIYMGLIALMYFPLMNYLNTYAPNAVFIVGDIRYTGIENVIHNGLFHAIRKTFGILSLMDVLIIISFAINMLVCYAGTLLKGDSSEMNEGAARIGAFVLMTSLIFPILIWILALNKWVLLVGLVIANIININSIKSKCFAKTSLKTDCLE